MSQERPLAGITSAESLLVAAGRDRRPGAPLNQPPISASNFVLGADRAYSRDDGTPTWEALEEIVGLLEGGQAVAFASGMAGVAAIFDQLRVGSQVVIPDDCYQGVVGLAELGRQKGRWNLRRDRAEVESLASDVEAKASPEQPPPETSRSGQTLSGRAHWKKCLTVVVWPGFTSKVWVRVGSFTLSH